MLFVFFLWLTSIRILCCETKGRVIFIGHSACVSLMDERELSGVDEQTEEVAKKMSN